MIDGKVGPRHAIWNVRVKGDSTAHDPPSPTNPLKVTEVEAAHALWNLAVDRRDNLDDLLLEVGRLREEAGQISVHMPVHVHVDICPRRAFARATRSIKIGYSRSVTATNGTVSNF